MNFLVVNNLYFITKQLMIILVKDFCMGEKEFKLMNIFKIFRIIL
jgi:hypothetical protein